MTNNPHSIPNLLRSVEFSSKKGICRSENYLKKNKFQKSCCCLNFENKTQILFIFGLAARREGHS